MTEEEAAALLAGLPDAQLREMLDTAGAIEKFRSANRKLVFQPTPKQMEFFALTKEKRECALFAGNQQGKSEAGAFALSCFLTGRYPAWWPGRKWDRPTHWWAAGESTAAVRDILQNKLCGLPGGGDETLGTGMLTRSDIANTTASHGAANAFDTISVRHSSGGLSSLGFKTYEMAVGKWQGTTLDGVLCDEEPPSSHYTEGLARTTATNGLMMLTFTPLKGYKQVVPRFLRETDPEAMKYRGYVKMGLKDATWYTEEERARIVAQYPEWERAARINGDPFLGSGAVFYGVSEENLYSEVALSQVPPHWFKLWGIDFGIGHAFAAVLMAWDKDSDTLYILHAIRMKDSNAIQHAAAMKAIDANAPVAWPHDGHVRDKGSGQSLAAIYKDQGLEMLPGHAELATGGYSLEGGIGEMQAYMLGNRFKVNKWLSEWLDEFRSYYRDEGLIVKVNDDLMSATRMATIQRRSARHGSIGNIYVDRVHGFGQRTAVTSSDVWSGV